MTSVQRAALLFVLCTDAERGIPALCEIQKDKMYITCTRQLNSPLFASRSYLCTCFYCLALQIIQNQNSYNNVNGSNTYLSIL